MTDKTSPHWIVLPEPVHKLVGKLAEEQGRQPWEILFAAHAEWGRAGAPKTEVVRKCAQWDPVIEAPGRTPYLWARDKELCRAVMWLAAKNMGLQTASGGLHIPRA